MNPATRGYGLYGGFALGLVPNGRRSVTPIPANVLALVEKPTDNVTVNKPGNPDPIKDTVPLLQRTVKRQLWQGAKLAKYLQGGSVYQTVKNDWNFIFKHIQYELDDNFKHDGKTGHEVLRSLRRLIYDGKGDCDCFTGALSNLLLNQGIPHVYRVAKYKDAWQHVYIVVPKNGSTKLENGKLKTTDYITLDCVVHQFDTEVPFIDNKDFPMSLISLDGIEDSHGTLGCTMGCACESGSSDQVKPKPERKILVASKQLFYSDVTPTAKVLQDAGIAFTQNNDPQRTISVNTPSGVQKFDALTPVLKKDALVKEIKQPGSASSPITLPASGKGNESVTTAANTSSPTTTMKPELKKVEAGGWALGILGVLLLGGALLSKKKAAATALSGPAKPAKKRMKKMKI